MFGMPLAECMERVSHPEYLSWCAWLDMQWNRPSRSDFYTMANTNAVVRGKDPNKQRLKFRDGTPVQPRQRVPGGPPGPLTKEDIVKVRTAMSKARLKANLDRQLGPKG
jgi:hypothetical protein